ncbi:uncharacterized protein LOC117111007 [Anneissia japonica]|uniref:uncharacterized protein LOC117111007 n=1 Tax=Anneissia japonica TaxID=1529436 RepID=UPI001425644D|nr:uncharacterized protein LOC117111007 [Anneissia japonica]
MAALDTKTSTSAVTTRQRSAPASAPTTRTPKQILRKRKGSRSSNSIPSTFRTPARGAGALSSPPSDVSLTPMAVSSRSTAIGHSVKRKLFDDSNEDNDDPRATKNTKKQNKAMVSAKRGRRSSYVIQKTFTSAVTTRQRSAPASASTTRTSKQIQQKRTGSRSSNSVPSTFQTPARGAGALSSPPSDVSLTPMAVSSSSTAIGHSVKRKLFDDSNNDYDEPRAAKITKKQNKAMVSAKRGSRSSYVVQDLQERLRHLPDVNAQKINTVPTMHKTRRSSQTKKTRNSASIRRIVSTLKEGLKTKSPLLTSMEMRNGKMKICNTK